MLLLAPARYFPCWAPRRAISGVGTNQGRASAVSD
jgi:hypothetical protein